MASNDKRKLANVVARLVGLGKDTRYIFTYLKMDKKFKRTPNATIQRNIDAFRTAFNRANAANKMDRSGTIKDIFKKDKKKAPKRVCVNYEFTHDAGNKKKRGSRDGASELGSVEVDVTDTIYEVRAKILDTIQLWLEAHYETSNKRTIKSSLKITSIQEC